MNRFLSFADSRMSAALERLGRQAEALDFFDEITLFTEHDLSAEFTSRMGRYLTPSCRGFGYWSWKPWVIHHVLQEMEEGDRLLYLDAGCHINANGTERFREYVNMLDRDSRGMLVFTNGQPEYKWTKGDIFRHFGVSQEDGHITHTQQIAGGHVFLKKNPLTESLIRDWLHVFYDLLHPMQTEGHYYPRWIGNLCGKLGTALLVSIPGQTGHGNPTGREKGMAGKMQAAPSFFQKKRIRNPVKLPHSEQPGCTTFPNGAI